MPPPGRFCALYPPFFEAGDLIFVIAAFWTFCQVLRKFQGSATFGSWDMTLFTRSCHGPKGRFTLSCAGSVFGTERIPYFANSTSLVSKSVIRHNRVNFKVKVNLGQSSCYFYLKVKFSTWPSEVKKYMFRCVLKRETRWCLNYSAIFLSSKVICVKL